MPRSGCVEGRVLGVWDRVNERLHVPGSSVVGFI